MSGFQFLLSELIDSTLPQKLKYTNSTRLTFFRKHQTEFIKKEHLRRFCNYCTPLLIRNKSVLSCAHVYLSESQ